MIPPKPSKTTTMTLQRSNVTSAICKRSPVENSDNATAVERSSRRQEQFSNVNSNDEGKTTYVRIVQRLMSKLRRLSYQYALMIPDSKRINDKQITRANIANRWQKCGTMPEHTQRELHRMMTLVKQTFLTSP